MISRAEILKNRELEYPLTAELEANLNRLLIAVNKLRHLYGKPMFCTSGYRPGHYNTDVKGGSKSSHLFCAAADFRDHDRSLTNFCTDDILEKCGLWMEDPAIATTWVHVQTKEPKSRIPGRTRVFKP